MQSHGEQQRFTRGHDISESFNEGDIPMLLTQRSFGRARLTAVAVVAAALAALAPLARAEAPHQAEAPREVPVPTVEHVPGDVGVRGGPYSHSHRDPSEFGYVEEEYFISGSAKSYGPDPGPDAEYRTRLYVLRPDDPARFNGTVILEWLNVTGGVDAAAVWSVAHEHLIREGFAYVGVTAQRAGQEGTAPFVAAVGPGPMALKQFDPVRYGTLHHPGDEYSWDIFAQAGMAILAGQPSPIGGYPVERLIATGQSQSGRFLRHYLVNVHESALRSPGRRVFDGVMPMTSVAPMAGDASHAVPDDLGPIIWVNEVRTGHSQADSGDFRLIEVASAPHFSWWGLSAATAANARAQHRDLPSLFLREDAAQFGERGGGPCPRGFFPDRFAYHAAIDHMDRWLRTGIAPKSWPRIERTEAGEVLLDPHGNTRGGFRLPVLDVPIATYEICGLFGSTTMFDPVKLAQLYPSREAYLSRLSAAIDEAVADGRMLQVDGVELLTLAAEALVAHWLAQPTHG
jgi:hypothetical protein